MTEEPPGTRTPGPHPQAVLLKLGERRSVSSARWLMVAAGAAIAVLLAVALGSDFGSLDADRPTRLAVAMAGLAAASIAVLFCAYLGLRLFRDWGLVFKVDGRFEDSHVLRLQLADVPPDMREPEALDRALGAQARLIAELRAAGPDEVRRQRLDEAVEHQSRLKRYLDASTSAAHLSEYAAYGRRRTARFLAVLVPAYLLGALAFVWAANPSPTGDPRGAVADALHDPAYVPPGTRLRGSDLRGMQAQDIDARGADLRGAVLRNAVIERLTLDDADLDGADLRGARIGALSMKGADLRGSDLRGVTVRDVPQFARAQFEGALLSPAFARRGVWTNARCPDGTVVGGTLTNCAEHLGR